MFRDGLSDVNVTDPATITKAKDDIAQVVEATNAQFDHVDYTDIPKGQAWLHQSWSGNVGSAFLFLPKGDEALNVSYYWPGSTDGIPGNVDNDTIVLLASGKAPVLAHMLANESWIPRTPTRTTPRGPDTRCRRRASRPTCWWATPSSPSTCPPRSSPRRTSRKGSRELELAPDADALWQAAYAELVAGV